MLLPPLIVQSTFAATIATIIDADVAKRATTLLTEIEYSEIHVSWGT